MNLTLFVWRQDGPNAAGRLERYEARDINEHMSFLELLDVVNEGLIEKGERPIEFEHDCREGICGSCGVVINGIAHGPTRATATCQLHLRHFRDGETITIEPWRAKGFPVMQDLVVDRGAFDRIVQAGGFISVNTGSAPEANSVPVSKPVSDQAMDAAQCIGCGACVAQCPNGAAHLFTAAKVGHLNILPHGQPERWERVIRMVEQMEAEAFGSCSNFRECEAVCPKEISTDWIARMNRDYLLAKLRERPAGEEKGGVG